MPPKSQLPSRSKLGASPGSSSTVPRSQPSCQPTRPSRIQNATHAAPRDASTTLRTASSSGPALPMVGRTSYGDVVESDVVHDEIRALGTEVKTMIAQHLPRHGTSEEQVAWGVRQFGPSKESRAALNKENEAAKLAWERGVYCVWRCTEPPKLRGATNDFCCRLGYRHVCFCGHSMAAHTTPACASNAAASASASAGRTPVTDRQLAQWRSPCEEAGCRCRAFRYVPNSPLEIGEGWLTRRANFKLSEWSAKCRCGHGHKVHDPASSSSMRCRSCGGCGGFVSAFLCVVCDLPWEAHETQWESEGVRMAAGLPVREAYAPLMGLEWDLREMVLKDATMGGKIEPSATHLAVQARQRVSLRSPTHGSIEPLPALASPPPSNSLVARRLSAAPGSGDEGAVADSVLDVEYCPACATVYKTAASKFCSQCGLQRPQRRSTLR